jgi:L-threonine kinase
VSSRLNYIHSEGVCPGSFGEILQGVLPNGKKFLVNMKISSKSCVNLKIYEGKGLVKNEINGTQEENVKAKKIIKNLIDDQALEHRCDVVIESCLPVGKGLSSSTADMTAASIALKKAFRLSYTDDYLSQKLAEIEPSDGLHYPGTSAFHHQTGEHIFSESYIPEFKIIGVDFGGMVDTIELNKENFDLSDNKKSDYETLLNKCHEALKQKNLKEIANIATQSYEMWQDVVPKQYFDETIALKSELSALGIINTHSGSYIGFLFPKDFDVLPKHLEIIKNKYTQKVEINIFDACNIAEEGL